MASQKIEEMKKAYKSGGADAARAVGEAYDSGKTTTTTTTPTATTTTATTPKNTTITTTAKPEYAGQGSTKSPQVNDTSWDTGNGQYTYNPQSGYYESNQTKTTTPVSSGKSDFATTWNNYSYEKQQELLNKTPNLKSYLANKGLTVKQPGETVSEETPKGKEETTTPKSGDGWDYQDNSPERMMQIVNNLEGLYQSDPGLFTDEQTFRNFFINGKGRTPEQEAFLMDYYKNRKTYNKYDGITAENAGNLLANGKLPQNYLDYVKNSNPDRYAAIMDAKDRAEDQIRANASLDTVNTMTGEDSTFQSKFLQWAKENGLLVDKDGNLVDDRMENYASDEEKTYQKKISDLYADILDIDNTVKHTYEDLVDRYPGASKATLMAMAQDTNSDLLREKENMTVELTRLQGYVGYMQAERQEMNAAGKNTIANLQKELGMYYSYSPEGLSELAQAQYAATNITLDQADSGTDTQKQMALQSVLDDYYEKYGSIIQRSEQQVINDVMALAKKKGISLSQALQENFITPLRNKPEYIQMVSGGVDGYGEWKVIGKNDLGNDVYGFVNTATGVVVPYGNVRGGYGTYGGGTNADGTYQFSEEEVRTGDTIGNDINSIGHILDSEDGIRVGNYKSSNGYTYNVYATREDGIQATENLLKKGYYGMTLEDAAQKWIGKGKDISTAKKVIKDKGLSLTDKLSDANVRKFIEAIGTWEGTLKGKSLDEWANEGKDLSGYKQPEGEQGTGKFDKSLANVYAQYAEANAKDKAQIAARNGKTTQQMDAEVYEYEGWKNAQDLKQSLDMVDRLLYGDIEIPPRLQRMDTIGGEENDLGLWGLVTVGNMSKRNTDWAAAHNLIYNTLGMDKFLDLKSKGATFGALSDDERRAIYDAASAFKANLSEEEYKRQLQSIRDSIIEAGRGYLDNYSYKGSTMDDAATKLGLVKSQKA